MKKALTGLAAALWLLWFAGALLADGELARAAKNREAFFNAPQKQQQRAGWLALIKEFEAAAEAQIQSRHAARSRFLAAELAYLSVRKFGRAEDYDLASALARRAVKDCPNCASAPSAQLVLGQALAARRKTEEAWRELLKVELNYPGSPEAAPARQALTVLGGGAPPPGLAPPKTAPKPPPPKKTAAAPPRKETPPQKAAPKAAAKPRKAPPAIPGPPQARADGHPQVYFLTLEDFGSHTTVTVYLDRVAPYVYNLLPPASGKGAFRAYVDLKGARLTGTAPARLREHSALVRLVKISQFNNETVRLVVDLPEAHPYAPAFVDQPPRLIFNVARDQAHLPTTVAEAQPEPAPQPKKKPEPAARGPNSSMARQLGLTVRRVVLDPGHGGRDSGAAAFGRREKDITLKAAKLLKAKLEKRLKLEVLLTRETDVFAALNARTALARERQADLFISIHVNANQAASVEGYETYLLNFATDDSAMAVAARENAASGKSLAELSGLLETIAKNTKVAESRVLARAMHKRALTFLRKQYKVRDLGVKEAPFVVLLGANVPAVLVEIGFITNEKEAARLAGDDYLNLLTDGLAGGVEAYIKGL